MTRLEEHRKKLEVEQYLGPLIPLHELTPEEVAIVNRSFLERCRRDRVEGTDGYYGTYVSVLHEWGIMCPHPQHRRLYDGLYASDVPLPFDEARWYHCGLCAAAVINR